MRKGYEISGVLRGFQRQQLVSLCQLAVQLDHVVALVACDELHHRRGKGYGLDAQAVGGDALLRQDVARLAYGLLGGAVEDQADLGTFYVLDLPAGTQVRAVSIADPVEHALPHLGQLAVAGIFGVARAAGEIQRPRVAVAPAPSGDCFGSPSSRPRPCHSPTAL